MSKLPKTIPSASEKDEGSNTPDKQSVQDCERQLDDIGRRWIDDGAIPRRADVPDLVYHYTDAAGLVGMLGSNKLWLTDSRFLNDRTEGVHLIQSVGDLIHKLIDATSDENLAKLYADLDPMLVSGTGSSLFIFSTSDRGDDLSQWRGYAREGQGFTIGLDADKLYELSRTKTAGFKFSKVEYDHVQQQRIAEKIVLEISDALVDMIKTHTHLDAADIINEATRTLSWTIRNRRGFSKHKSFESEGEWRIYTSRTQASEQIRVRSSGLALVPYIEIEPCGPNTKLPIKSIGIGPGFENAQIGDAVSSLCRQNGYSPEIWFADTPYRRP